MVEFVLVAALGFGIYLAYVEREGENAHLVYLGAVLIAATANMLMFQALDLYRVPAFSAFVRSFTRITVAWTLVMGGMMALAFFGKVGAEFSRVWIATWYLSALFALFSERLALSLLAKRWIKEGRLSRRAVIVGGGHEAEELIKALEASKETDDLAVHPASLAGARWSASKNVASRKATTAITSRSRQGRCR